MANKFSKKELDYLKDVLNLESQSSTIGNYTLEVEQKSSKLFERKFSICQNSGTSTLHSALKAIGVSFGDEVISPAFTVIMNTAVTLQCGAIPVYVDVDPETYCIDPKDLEKKITPKTKAVQIVSVYGQSPEYDSIMEICNKRGIHVIEDNAETIFGFYKGKMAGTFGTFSSLSLEDSKHLSCGEGGILLGDSEDLMKLARKYAGHGFRTLEAENGRIRLNPDQWQHPDFLRHDYIGYNYRMSEFQSAIALAQLEKIEELVYWRKKSGKEITEIIENSKFFEIQKTPDYIEHSYWCVGARFLEDTNSWVNFRDQLFKNCGERVFGAWQVPYLEPVMQNGNFREYLHPVDRNINYEIGLCPNAEIIQKQMMVFKTKYRSKEEIDNLKSGLEKTLKNFK